MVDEQIVGLFRSVKLNAGGDTSFLSVLAGATLLL